MRRRSILAGLSTVLALAAVAHLATPATAVATGTASSRQAAAALVGAPRAASIATERSETPVSVPDSETPPPGRRLSSDQVLEIADRLTGAMAAVRARHPGSFGDVYLKGPGRWQVSYFSRNDQEIGVVIIADSSGKVLEQWTGIQVAWTMARGYPGAFGGHVNAPYVWLPLCLLFVLPFIRPRRPFSMIHLDLLVLLSFSVSLAFFNHADIYASVPLTYPPLIYLLVRMLVLARVRLRASRSPQADEGRSVPRWSGDRRVRPREIADLVWIPVPWLAVAVVSLIGFRVVLNVVDSNVIDVGYAGVIGAQRITTDRPLYGGYPKDNEHGDTYGPVNYEAYVPFEQLFGWSGTWDDLPAAHAAAIVFDLLSVLLLFLLGRRVRGPDLGVILAYAWVSYPFTLFTMESNSNDSLVSVMLLAVLLVATSPPARGVFAALAGLTKFAPLVLAPLLATHGLRERSRHRMRALILFILAFVATVAIVFIPAVTHDSLRTIYQRTLVYQDNRGTPFSIWGLYGGLGSIQTAVQIAAVLLALALAVLPRRPDVIGLAAASAAAIIASQLATNYWFYLYIPWFFGLVIFALLGARCDPGPARLAAGRTGSLSRPSPPPRPRLPDNVPVLPGLSARAS